MKKDQLFIFFDIPWLFVSFLTIRDKNDKNFLIYLNDHFFKITKC